MIVPSGKLNVAVVNPFCVEIVWANKGCRPAKNKKASNRQFCFIIKNLSKPKNGQLKKQAGYLVTHEEMP